MVTPMNHVLTFQREVRHLDLLEGVELAVGDSHNLIDLGVGTHTQLFDDLELVHLLRKFLIWFLTGTNRYKFETNLR